MSRTVCATAFLAALAAPLTANAQAINYGTLDAQQPNAVHAEVGAEHAFVMSAGYSRTLELGDRPLVVGGMLTVPWAKLSLDDYQLRAAVSAPLVGDDKWRLAGRVAPTLRGTKNDVNRMTGFATDFSLFGGYYAPKGFVAASLGFDWAISTHIKHTDEYRRTVYADAKDGWYASPGGNFHAGLQGGLSIRSVELTMRLEHVRDVRLQPLLLPLAATIGANVHW